MVIFDMLLAVPKYGRVKTNRILTQCRISPSKTIGGLSERQRTELVGLLRVHWRGLSGGTEVWERVGGFFTELRGSARVKPASGLVRA